MNKEELLESLKKKEFPPMIIEAFATVNRELFLPEHLKLYASEDIALPIEDGTTTSQPSTIALMLNLANIEANHRILEVGSGSGYVLALLAYLAPEGDIYGIDMNQKIAIKTKNLLTDQKNIHILIRNGIQGLPEHAPFNRIIVSASAQDLTILNPLIAQLHDPGILVAPVKDSIFQIKKANGQIEKNEFPGFAFVPLKNE